MIGQPIPRVEDRRFVTGNGQYTDDLRVEGQPFLREAALHPNTTQIPGHKGSPVHARMRPRGRLLNHWLYPAN